MKKDKFKKIFFIIPSIAGGGTERVLVNLLENFDKNKLKPICIFYYSFNVYQLPSDIRVFNLRLARTNSKFRKIMRSFKRIIKIIRLINAENPDVIFSFLNRVNIITIIAYIFSRHKPKLIISERNSPSHELSTKLDKIIIYLMRILYPRAHEIVANSVGIKIDLIENFNLPEDKIKVIFNPVNLEKIKKLAKEEIDEHKWFKERIPIIINVARLVEQKGQIYLIKAFKLVRECISARLVILGNGEMKNYLVQIANDLGISDDIYFLGFQKNPYKFMKNSSIFILSSLFEGFPNVIIEAMACGTPVISSDCPSGPGEIITSGTNGILVPPADENDLAEAILSLLKDKNLREKFYVAGIKRAEDFGLEKILPQYEELF